MNIKKEKEIPRFDHLWRDALKWHSYMVKHSNGMMTAVRLFRRAAYRFAQTVILMQEHCHNEFVQFAANTGFDVTVWMDEHFGPIEDLGDDRRTLMANIKAGMTEKQYIEQGRLWIVRRRVKAPTKAAHVDIEDQPVTEPMTIEEKLDHAATENAALRSEVRQLRRDLAIALDENERLTKTVSKMQKLLNAVAKSNRKIG